MLAEMTTKADISEIEDQIATADVGDGDQLLDYLRFDPERIERPE